MNRPSIDAALVRHGLSVSVQPGHPGTRIDRGRTSDTIVSELGSLDRTATVALAVASTTPSVRQTDLREAAVQAQTALSAPIRLAYGETRWKLPRWRIAPLLQLPSGGSTHVTIGGPGADRYLERLSHTLARKPQDARFQVTAAGKIVIVPSQPGLELDPSATARAIGVAAFSSTQRTAQLVARVDEPKRSTEQARKMGITDAVSSYTTTYGGTPGRLHNVQLVAQLIDGALVAPDGTFSFNGTTGERTAEKGFEVAPVIINGELQNGLGGGICQVSTTVFNTAYEAGLPITARTNHALYISHYPLGRDATVNYPDLDLKFRNDTGHWLLLRTFVGAGSLTVNLYGTPVHRRVESSTAPLRVTGSVQVKRSRIRRSRRESARSRRRFASARDERGAQGVTTRTENCSTTTRGGRPTSVNRRFPCRHEKPAKPKNAATAVGPHRRDAPRERPRTPHRRSAGELRPNHGVGCEPRWNARRLRASRGDECVGGRARRDPLARSLDHVLVAEAGAADVDAAQVDRQHVVEGGRTGRTPRERPWSAPRPHAPGSICSRRHDRRGTRRGRPRARRRYGRVMGDALRVGLGEPHTRRRSELKNPSGQADYP